MKDMTVPIDQAGRIVLPKDVREELAIQPGDLLKVTIHGASVTLTPNKEKSGLMRKGKALVFSSPGNEMMGEEISLRIFEQERAEREARAASGLLRRKRHA